MSKSKTKDTQRQETVQPIVPDPEMGIIRKTEEDGTINYYHPIGRSTKTYKGSPYEVFDMLLNRIEAVVGLMMEDDVSFVLDGLVENSRRQMEEMFEMIGRTIGFISVHIVDRKQIAYRHGRVVGVSLEPPKSGSGETEVADDNE